MDTTQTKTAAAMDAEAKARIENLQPARIASEIEAAKALLVDIREADERAQNGVIKGAVHAPRGMIEFYADPTSRYHRPESQLDRRTILQGASGGRTALATDTVTRLRYRRVALLAGA